MLSGSWVGMGGETKPYTVDVLNYDTGLPMVPICGASFVFCTQIPYVLCQHESDDAHVPSLNYSKLEFFGHHPCPHKGV
jgi:hypothetical protein